MTTNDPAAIASLKDVPDGGHTLVASNEPELEPGLVIDGRFRICATVGRSGMATIYRAEDLLMGGREVALKIPLLRVESDPACFARFLNEEEAGLRFDHPYLVTVHRVEGRKSRPYLAMEFLRGSPLAHVMDRMRPLPEGDALKIAAMICEALAHMHGRGVIHRDLKPSNIMICRDGGFRLFDFGLASPPLRRRGVFAWLTPTLGTPEYMAPEQVRNGSIDERADVYGVGAILYEMLTGEVPFRREDPWASGFARLSGDPKAPRLLNPKLSTQAEEIVLRALRRKPADRFQTVLEFKAALDAPDRVPVTGLRDRLQISKGPRLSFQATPIRSGALIGLGTLIGLLALFLLLRIVLRA